jgi:hypothetical protein
MFSKKKQSKTAIQYAQRLFEDEYVQGQLRDAAGGIRSAYDRISKKPERAAEDKKVYASVRRAATSIRNAFLALRRPEPEPEPRHRFRTVLLAIAVVAASVLVISKRGSEGPSAADINATGVGASPSYPPTEQFAEPQTAPSTDGE